MNESSYKPTVAWTTIVSDVVLLAEDTYRVTVKPEDVNEPGALSIVGLDGYYLTDFIGNSYNIIDVGTDGNPHNITVYDSLKRGIGPQVFQYGIVYRSVGNGEAPHIAPIRYDRLDNSSLDQSRAVELDILWKNLMQKHIREKLIGVIDNNNKTFTTTLPFKTNSTTLFLNGLEESHYIELDNGSIMIDFAPQNIGFIDLLEISYIQKII